MRKLILQMSISVDGFVAAPDGSHPWGYEGEDPATKRWKLDALRAAGAHLMGRVTYEHMTAAWPSSSSDYAAPMNEIPKVVFSRTLESADWAETRIARGELAAEIAALKAEPGGDLLAHGGSHFARSLARERLVDEYRLLVQPAALGSGMPLFADLGAPLYLELAEAETDSTGVALHVYRARA